MLDRCDGKANRESTQDENQPIRQSVIRFVVYVLSISPLSRIERVADQRRRQPAGDLEQVVNTDVGPHGQWEAIVLEDDRLTRLLICRMVLVIAIDVIIELENGREEKNKEMEREQRERYTLTFRDYYRWNNRLNRAIEFNSISIVERK